MIDAENIEMGSQVYFYRFLAGNIEMGSQVYFYRFLAGCMLLGDSGLLGLLDRFLAGCMLLDSGLLGLLDRFLAGNIEMGSQVYFYMFLAGCICRVGQRWLLKLRDWALCQLAGRHGFEHMLY